MIELQLNEEKRLCLKLIKETIEFYTNGKVGIGRW
jgi:hypothetical protein